MASGGNDGYYDEDGDFDPARDFGAEPQATSRSYLTPEQAEEYALNGTVGNPYWSKTDNKSSNKQNFLKNSEKNASKDPNKNGRGGDKEASLKEKEGNVNTDKNDESTASKINNAVKGAKELASGNKFKAIGSLKKSGPLLAVVVVLLFLAGASFFGQASMGFSLLAQLQETFDSISTSQGIRTKAFLRFQTNNKNNTGCIKAHYFRPDEFKPSTRQIKKLGNQGIHFETDSDGVMVMKYYPDPNDTTKTRTIVADASQAGGDRVAFSSIYDSDATFRERYNEGTNRWRKSEGAWYDTSMPGFLKKIGIATRNLFKKFTGNTNTSEEDMRTTISGEADSDTATGKAHATEIETEKSEGYDDEGNKVEKTEKKAVSTSEESTTISRTDATDGTINTKLTSLAKSAIGGTATAANVYCAVSDAVGAITAVTAAYQTIQIVKLASGIFEGIQKTQAGDGANAPYNEIGTSLTKRVENTYEEDGGVVIDPNDKDKFIADESKASKITRSRSAMEANAVSAIYGGTTVDPNDPSVKSFNINEMSTNMWKGFSSGNGVIGALTDLLGSTAANMDTSAKAFKSCTVAKLAAATVQAGIDVAETAIEIAACLGTGVGCVVDLLKEAAEATAKNAFKSIITSIVVSLATKHVTKVLLRTVVTDVAGEDLGNALVDAANIYMGRNHQYSGGAVANKESLVAYLQAQDQIIAENARYERETRSPFDITSKYTFLGSLASQMIPLASQMTSVTSTLSGMSTVITNSLISLTPKSSAISAGIEAQAAADLTAQVNPNLADLGGVGDVFGNPFIITDVKTLGMNPAENVNNVDNYTASYTGEEKNLLDVTDATGENVPKIGKKSRLAKYIQYCGGRQSPFGMADQNIANDVDAAGNVGGTIGQAVANGLGVVGDIIDIASNTNKLRNMGWISGRSCVIGNQLDGDTDASIDWEEASVYQRFIEDQRLAEAEGIIEKSAVTEYLAEYYEENPLDNSFEGILARYSGLTKENVAATLDIMDVASFIADYKPTDLYPYPKTDGNEQPKIILEEKNNILAIDALTMKNVIYYTNRSRNFAA